MKRQTTLSKSATDWARLDAMQDKDIDLSDNPELTPEMFAKAVARHGLKPVPNRQSRKHSVRRDIR